MKNGLIITFDGSIARKENCKYIKGDFYEINSQCFCIDGRWYRINSGYIVYDHEKNTYVIKNSELIHGIVGITEEGWDIGFFSENPSKNIIVLNEGVEVIAISEAVVKSRNLVELQYGTKEVFISEEEQKRMRVKSSVIPYKLKERLPYNSKELLEEASKNYERYYFNHKKPDEYCSICSEEEASRLIGTFGIEFESQTGRIPNRFLYRLGLIPLRDGSITGDEYATIPFKGTSKNLQTLEDIVTLMKKYVTIDFDNSLHIHQRLQSFSREYFVSSFLVNSMIESEIFSLFPAFYSRTSMFKRSGKDYNNPLPNLHSMEVKNPLTTFFSELYSIYSDGHTFNENRGTSIPHPNDPGEDHKWQVGIRYIWVNYVPYLFGGSNTIEYRIHPPTLNFNKIIAWVYITNAILAFSQKIIPELKQCKTAAEYLVNNPMNLISIISNIYPRDSYAFTLCINYIMYRKKIRKYMDDNGDGAGNWELKHDDEFSIS